MHKAAPMFAVLICAALAGCQGEKKAAATGGASGEVLESSISDAMIPVDSVRSQPPLAPRSEATGEGAGAGGKPAAQHKPAVAPKADAPAATPEPAPPAEPAPDSSE